MALNSLFKLNNINTNFFQKLIRHLINRTCTKFVLGYSSFSPFSPTFFLATIIYIEVDKTDTSFLAFFFKIIAGVIALFFIKKTLNIEEVFFFFLAIILIFIIKMF